MVLRVIAEDKEGTRVEYCQVLNSQSVVDLNGFLVTPIPVETDDVR